MIDKWKKKGKDLKGKTKKNIQNKWKQKQTKSKRQRKLCDDVSGNRGGVIAAEILRGPQEVQGSPETLRRQGRDWTIQLRPRRSTESRAKSALQVQMPRRCSRAILYISHLFHYVNKVQTNTESLDDEPLESFVYFFLYIYIYIYIYYIYQAISSFILLVRRNGKMWWCCCTRKAANLPILLELSLALFIALLIRLFLAKCIRNLESFYFRILSARNWWQERE